MNILSRTWWIAGLALLLLGSPALAQEEEDLDYLDDLEAFIDGILAAQMEAYHVAGAVVAVVEGDDLVFSKGYGYADVEGRVPVEPAETLFRIGSTTKLFTWTAVMQLAEQGLLDLDADINEYLEDFQIPERYGEPITMRHLMAHTAGFEERIIGLFARDTEALRPLGEILADDLPRRVRPPGQRAAYSNHGVGIAGYIVEQVSGTSWADYVREHIFDPLEMAGSTAHQPVPEELEPNLSNGYVYRDGRFEERPFEFVPLGPAGTISATAEDMANFMIAHLQLGEFGDVRILGDSTAQVMHERHFTHDERVSGMAHGFIEQFAHGFRLIGHGGDTQLFHTDMVLIPEADIGLFVSYNSEDGTRPRSELVRAFMDYYLANEPPPVPAANNEAAERAEQVAGVYLPTRRSHSTVFKLVSLTMSPSVVAREDGSLLVSGIGEEPSRWVEVEPYVYEALYGPERLVFVTDEEGEVTHFYHANLPILAFERAAFYETQSFNFTLLGVTVLLFLLTIIVWVRSLFRRRGQGGFPMVARLMAGSASALFLLFLVLLMVGLGDEPFEIVYGMPPLVQTALTVAIVGTILSVIAAVFVIPVWRSRYWRPRSRIYYSIVVLALLAFVWFLFFWNLLGYQY